MNILKKLMQRLCGCGKHDGREHVQSLTAQLRLGPADILESDENGIIPVFRAGEKWAQKK